jgi:uncharacterized protein (DUF924 family)
VQSAASILSFWLGADPDDTAASVRHASLWWSKDDALDREIARRFGRTVGAAARGELDDWCLTGLDRKVDRELRPIERWALYLPLEHSEDRGHQARCVRLFEDLVGGVPEAERPILESAVSFARQHQVIVERFGRFPHRNAALERPSTAEELAFLQEEGSSF